MNLSDAGVVLSTFREKYPNLLDPTNVQLQSVIAVHVVANDQDEPVVKILLTHESNAFDLPVEFQITEIDVPLLEKVVSVEYVTQAAVQVLGTPVLAPSTRGSGYRIPAGTLAQATAGGLRGTFGWGFMYGSSAYAVSNWHILCPNGNATPRRTTRIELDTHEVSSLSFFDEVTTMGNKWDFALARIDDPDMITGEYKPCYDGNPAHPYPQDLTRTRLQDNTPHYSVGNRDPFCTKGVSKGVANVKVHYPGGVVREFTDQLLFEMIVEKGDSGSVVVQTDTNTVSGLLFAAALAEGKAYANPLPLKNWVRRGTHTTMHGTTLPVFDIDVDPS